MATIGLVAMENQINDKKSCTCAKNVGLHHGNHRQSQVHPPLCCMDLISMELYCGLVNDQMLMIECRLQSGCSEPEFSNLEVWKSMMLMLQVQD